VIVLIHRLHFRALLVQTSTRLIIPGQHQSAAQRNPVAQAMCCCRGAASIMLAPVEFLLH